VSFALNGGHDRLGEDLGANTYLAFSGTASRRALCGVN